MISTRLSRAPSEQPWISELPPSLDDAGGGLFRGRLPGGTPVLVRRLPPSGTGPAEERAVALRRLAGIRDPHLVRVVGAAAENGQTHLVAAWERGETLSSLLDEGYHFDPVQVVAIGFGVLRGLAALQRAGLAYGRLDRSDVLVTARGEVKLAGASGDVRSAGELLSRLLGAEAETEAPALLLVARSLADGAAGRSPAHALAIWRDAAGMAASERAQLAARKALATAVRTRTSPVGRAVGELLARAPAAATQRSARLTPPALGVTLAGLALVLLGALLVFGALHRLTSPASAPTRKPAPAHAAASIPSGPAPAPDEAVRRFFALVAQHRYDQAARYCTPRLLAANPPQELVQRYGDFSAIDLRKDQVVDLNQSAGIANVAVTVSLKQGGVTRVLNGNAYLATGPEGWRIDRYVLS